MADNPFAPITDDERVVMNHLKTVLGRLPSDAERSFLASIFEQDIPPLGKWTSERETTDPVPETVHLLGLSKRPPDISTSDFHSRSGGGPIDLYAESDHCGLGIEGKTKDPLRVGQLERYATALDADSIETATWTDVHRALSEVADDLDAYPAGVVDDFLDFLDLSSLYKPAFVAKYHWGDSEGIKEIRVEGRDELRVRFRVKDFDNGRNVDNRPVPWARFCNLFEDVESRHGRDFIRRVFVEGERFDEQPELDGDVVLGETSAVRTSDSNRLRLNSHSQENALKLREVKPPKGNTLGSPAGGGEQYCWYVKPNELRGLLLESPDDPGFPRRFRRFLFLDRDVDQVESYVW